MQKMINETPTTLQMAAWKAHTHPTRSNISMTELKPGQQGVISKVPTTDLLPELSIRVGKRVNIITYSLAGGPILVRVDNRSIAIDLEIARDILLDPGK